MINFIRYCYKIYNNIKVILIGHSSSGCSMSNLGFLMNFKSAHIPITIAIVQTKQPMTIPTICGVFNPGVVILTLVTSPFIFTVPLT